MPAYGRKGRFKVRSGVTGLTIQISVLLWTVITFCILMFFLNKFLFKPLLAFMDAREQKIASARERREKAALALETAER